MRKHDRIFRKNSSYNGEEFDKYSGIRLLDIGYITVKLDL